MSALRFRSLRPRQTSALPLICHSRIELTAVEHAAAEADEASRFTQPDDLTLWQESKGALLAAAREHLEYLRMLREEKRWKRRRASALMV